MPSLNRVREVAKRVVWASNVRQLYLGVAVYAEKNDGRMPYHIKADASTSSYHPYETYSIHHYSTPADDLIQGLGRLYHDCVADVKSYFCPSMKDTVFQYPRMPKSTPYDPSNPVQLSLNQWVGDEPYRMPGTSICRSNDDLMPRRGRRLVPCDICLKLCPAD